MDKNPKTFIVNTRITVPSGIKKLAFPLSPVCVSYAGITGFDPVVLSKSIIFIHVSIAGKFFDWCARSRWYSVISWNTIVFSPGLISSNDKIVFYDKGAFFVADRSTVPGVLRKKIETLAVRKGENILRNFLTQNFSSEVKSLSDIVKNQNDFLQMAVHDLRSPLSAMICYSELLMDGALGNISGEGLEPIKIIHQNCQFLINMVNDLLDSAQMEAGKKSLKLVRANINNLIRKVIRSLDGLARKKDLIINEKLNAVPDIFIDPEKMERIIINLLGNAIKFTKTGGKINIRCICKENHILFSIQDTGSGISQKDLKKIFEKFHMGDQSTITGKGHGLGLVITKSFVEMHGGRIFVKSQRNKGSTFLVRLCVEKRLEPVKKRKEQKVVVLDMASDNEELKNLKKIGRLNIRRFTHSDNWKKKFTAISCAGLIINTSGEYGFISPDILNLITSRKMKKIPCLILINEVNRIEDWKMFSQFNRVFVQKPYSHDVLVPKLEELIISDRRKNNYSH